MFVVFVIPMKTGYAVENVGFTFFLSRQSYECMMAFSFVVLSVLSNLKELLTEVTQLEDVIRADEEVLWLYI